MAQKYLLGGNVAKPVHIQRLEKNLDLEPFLSYVEQKLNTPINDENSSSSDDDDSLSNAGDDVSLTNIESM